jgi:hypothetical protein
MTATGPPHLPLVDRGPLLRQIREHIDAADMRPDLALVGNWRRRVVAQGSAVLDILFEDEEQADARGMWWTHDVRWSDTEGGHTCSTKWTTTGTISCSCHGDHAPRRSPTS